MFRQRVTTLAPRVWAARGIVTAALLAACGQDAQPEASAAADDAAGAYAALSAELDACANTLATCQSDAAGNQDKSKACNVAADSCKAHAASKEEHARGKLQSEAAECWKHCHGEDDAGPGGSGTDMHRCVERHAPKLPKCVEGLFMCLNEAGIRKHDATRAEITACVQSAHMCFMEQLATLRDAHHGSGAAGAAGGGAAGAGSHEHSHKPRWGFPGWGHPKAGSSAGAAGSQH